MIEDLSEMKVEMRNIKKSLAKIEVSLDITVLDGRYARKTSVDRIWTILRSIIWFVFLSLGGVIIGFFIRTPFYFSENNYEKSQTRIESITAKWADQNFPTIASGRNHHLG